LKDGNILNKLDGYWKIHIKITLKYHLPWVTEAKSVSWCLKAVKNMVNLFMCFIAVLRQAYDKWQCSVLL
jgi:hypothetical protein